MSRFYWIKLGVNVRRQVKVIALMNVLQDSRAWDYIVALWCYCCEHYPEGKFPTSVEAAVESAVGWEWS